MSASPPSVSSKSRERLRLEKVGVDDSSESLRDFDAYWQRKGMGSPVRDVNLPLDDELGEYDTPRNWRNISPLCSPNSQRVSAIAEKRRTDHNKARRLAGTMSIAAKPEYKPVAPTRFLDKVEFLMRLEQKRRRFAEERKDLGNFIDTPTQKIDFRSLLDTKTAEELDAEIREAEERARYENKLMRQWELRNDRKFYNAECLRYMSQKKYGKALEYSRLYITKCEPEKMQSALERQEEILRVMGKKFRLGVGKKDGGRPVRPKKYKTPIALHQDLLQLKRRSANTPVASLTSTRPTSRGHRSAKRVGQRGGKKRSANLENTNPGAKLIRKTNAKSKKMLLDVQKSLVKVRQHGIRLK